MLFFTFNLRSWSGLVGAGSTAPKADDILNGSPSDGTYIPNYTLCVTVYLHVFGLQGKTHKTWGEHADCIQAKRG